MFSGNDKAVSTSSDGAFTNCCDERNVWNLISADKFVNTLVSNKLLSIKEIGLVNDLDFDDSESSLYSITLKRGKQPPDKKQTKLEQRVFGEQKHGSHCRKQPAHTHEGKREQRSSISKVQKWSNEYEMDSFFNATKNEEELRLWPPELKNTELLVRANVIANDIELKPKPNPNPNPNPSKRRKRKRRRKIRGVKKISHINPEDLPKRARWTIIITSGLLVLTCMFLVGITLRMAPIIDQMVKTQNMELMNSLNRDTEANPAGYYSLDMWDKSPQERAREKYGRSN